jgi:hypothetical protein
MVINDNIRTQLQGINLKERVKKQREREKEKWYAHIGSVGDNSITSLVTEYKLHRRRELRQPRKSWREKLGVQQIPYPNVRKTTKNEYYLDQS